MPALPSPSSFFVVALACAAALVSRPAGAQTAPLFTVSGGYAGISEGELSMPGFYVEGERRLTRRLSVIGQVHRATGSGEGYFSTIDWTDLFVGGGLRLSGRPAAWFEPFGHVIVGPYSVKTVEVATPNRFGRGINDSYTEWEIATLVGGGATFLATPSVGFRIGADVQVHPDALPNARFSLGLVVPIGRR